MANVLNTTFAAARKGFLQYTGNWYGGTTTSEVSSTVIADTLLAIYQDDFFNLFWALPTSGTYSGQIRRVSDFVNSTGQATVGTAFGGAIATSVTYELCAYHPVDDIRQAINEALMEVYPWLGRSIINEDLISGNWLPNGAMNDWDVSTVPNKWALVGAAASVTEDTSTLWALPSAALVRAGTDCYIHCSDVQWPTLLDLGGKTIRFEALVYATVASRARLNALVNGASVGASSYHTGGSAPELLRTDEITITDSPTAISFRCEVNTGNTTAYFAKVRVIGPQIYEYLCPLAFSNVDTPNFSIQAIGTQHGNERPCDDLGAIYPYTPLEGAMVYDDAKGYWKVRLPQSLLVGYKIRMEGREYFTAGSADTDTISLNSAQMMVIYCKAAEILYRKKGNGAKEEKYRDLFKDLRTKHSISIPLERPNFGDWKY